MKIRQLQFLIEIEKQRFNVTAAATALNTSQPSISKQVRLLEQELGVAIFSREDGRLTGLTPIGMEVIGRAKAISFDAAYITSICKSSQQAGIGSLTIATTHVQSCYVLPEIISRFSKKYPKVKITLHQATPSEIIDLLHRGDADIGFTSDPPKSKDIVNLPCLNFERIIIVPAGHPLLDLRRVTLKAMIDYPLITYESSYKSREKILKSFEKAGLNPSIVLSVSDADVIKTCVKKGIGIGVLLEVAYDPKNDHGIRSIQANNLFPAAKICAMLNRNHHVRMYSYDFIEEVSGRWNRSNVQRAVSEKHKIKSD